MRGVRAAGAGRRGRSVVGWRRPDHVAWVAVGSQDRHRGASGHRSADRRQRSAGPGRGELDRRRGGGHPGCGSPRRPDRRVPRAPADPPHGDRGPARLDHRATAERLRRPMGGFRVAAGAAQRRGATATECERDGIRHDRCSVLPLPRSIASRAMGERVGVGRRRGITVRPTYPARDRHSGAGPRPALARGRARRVVSRWRTIAA